MKYIYQIGLSLLAGSLYALSYPSFIFEGHIVFLFLGLLLFIWLFQKSSSIKMKFSIVLFYNMGVNLTGFYWIPHTLQEFGQLPYWICLILSFFFSLILQPHWWVYLIWERFKPKLNWSRESLIIITAFILTLLERFAPQQFPIFVGSPWLHFSPYLGMTPFFGAVIFSFFTYWISLEFIQQFTNKKIRYQVWIVFILFITLNFSLPLKNMNNQINSKNLYIRLVQANIGNFLKISSEYGDKNSFEAVRKKYFDLSTQNLKIKPDLIIWPETAYPDSFYGKNTRINDLFKKIIDLTGAELLIGGYNQISKNLNSDIIESVYNSSILISDYKFKSSYHKNILIPFGETLPFGPFNESIVSIVPTISLFARGQGSPLMETKSHFRFVTPICYEILETNYMRTLLNQYGENHFIVNHTNDSWYGKTAEPYQHLFLSKWRALEFSLPIVRSTNTGITSVIFPDGSESKRLEINEENFLDLELKIIHPQKTFYQKFGFLPTLILILFLWLITWIRERKEILL